MTTVRPDEEILKDIQQGDKAAFNELYNRYWKKVYLSACSKIRSREASEEIVEDFFIQLWQKRHTLVIDNFSAYLYTSIKNRCLNYLQQRTIESKHWEYYKQFVPEFDDTTNNSVAFNNLMEAIYDGMKQMPEKSKKVFEMSKLEGKSIKEIARSLKLSEKAIEYHLTCSVKKLRLYLKEFILFILIIILVALP